MVTGDPLSLGQAKRLAANADTVLLRATRSADLETPIGAFLRLDDGGPGLPARVRRGRRAPRPVLVPRRRPAPAARGPRRPGPHPEPPGRASTRSTRTCRSRSPRPPTRWRRCARSCRGGASRRLEGMPRFTGGAVGALAYDAVTALRADRAAARGAIPSACPTAAFIETDLVLVFDHLTHTLSAIASLHTEAPDLEGRYRIAEAAIFEALERTARPSAAELAAAGPQRGRRLRASRHRSARPTSRTSLGRDEYVGRGRVREGRDRRGRGDPGRARPAPVVRPPARSADRQAARRDRALPRPAPGQPEPVPVLRAHADVRGRRRVARSSSSRSKATGSRRTRSPAPARAAPTPGRGRSSSPSSSSATPRSVPST